MRNEPERYAVHGGIGGFAMSKVSIVYWSQTGNTQAMAEAVAKGAEAAGAQPELIFVTMATVDMLKEAKAFALGCPAMGDEVLEEADMEPFMTALEAELSGKSVALFGSYGWGDGQWMREWEERIRNAGAAVINGEGVICQDAPDEDALAECENLGGQLAAAAE